MTTDLAAPPQTRPPHINRDWWYRATWHARQAAINTHNKRTRPADNARAYDPPDDEPVDTSGAYSAPLKAITPETQRLIDAIDGMLIWAASVDDILRELGVTVGAIEKRMRLAGRKDLARMFAAVRNASRYKPCPDCGKNICHASARCRPCSFRAKEVRAA